MIIRVAGCDESFSEKNYIWMDPKDFLNKSGGALSALGV